MHAWAVTEMRADHPDEARHLLKYALEQVLVPLKYALEQVIEPIRRLPQVIDSFSAVGCREPDSLIAACAFVCHRDARGPPGRGAPPSEVRPRTGYYPEPFEQIIAPSPFVCSPRLSKSLFCGLIAAWAWQALWVP